LFGCLPLHTQWWHFWCLGIDEAPASKFVCPLCAEKRKKKRAHAPTSSAAAAAAGGEPAAKKPRANASTATAAAEGGAPDTKHNSSAASPSVAAADLADGGGGGGGGGGGAGGAAVAIDNDEVERRLKSLLDEWPVDSALLDGVHDLSFGRFTFAVVVRPGSAATLKRVWAPSMAVAALISQWVAATSEDDNMSAFRPVRSITSDTATLRHSA
jgi:hypothetical protein